MNSIYKFVIPFLFFIQYFGIGILAQFIIVIFILIELLNGNKLRLTQNDYLLFFSVLVIFIFKFLFIPFDANFLLLRFYWGFILFYIFFSISKFKLNYVNLFWATVIITIVEFILINYFIPLEMMKNIPQSHIELLNLESNLGLVKRCYGLASSPTSSATILVVLLACIYKFQTDSFKNIFLIVTGVVLVLFGSGTGFLIFLIFIAIRYRLFYGLKFLMGLVFLILFVFLTFSIKMEDGGFLMRLSSNYLEKLSDLKIEQFNEVMIKLNNSTLEMFFGVNYKSIEETRVMSDFGWVDFLECYGILGPLMLVGYFVFKRIIIFLPVLLIVLANFHYPSIGSIPGQILLGSILFYHTSKKVNSDQYLYSNLFLFQKFKSLNFNYFFIITKQSLKSKI